MPEILLPVCQHRPVPKTIGKRESSFDGDRLDQVPAVGIEVFEDGNDAIRFGPRFLDEADTPLRIGKVVTGKVIRFEKQEHATTTLIADHLALPVTDSLHRWQWSRRGVRRDHGPSEMVKRE